jgi:hypothetical protein
MIPPEKDSEFQVQLEGHAKGLDAKVKADMPPGQITQSGEKARASA